MSEEAPLEPEPDSVAILRELLEVALTIAEQCGGDPVAIARVREAARKVRA